MLPNRKELLFCGKHCWIQILKLIFYLIPSISIFHKLRLSLLLMLVFQLPVLGLCCSVVVCICNILYRLVSLWKLFSFLISLKQNSVRLWLLKVYNFCYFMCGCCLLKQMKQKSHNNFTLPPCFFNVLIFIRYPANITLLRGNHESRQLTQVFFLSYHDVTLFMVDTGFRLIWCLFKESMEILFRYSFFVNHIKFYLKKKGKRSKTKWNFAV